MRIDSIRSDNSLLLLLKAIILLGSVALVALLYVAVVGYRDEQMGQMIIVGMFALAITVSIFLRPQYGAYILIITTYTYISTILTDRGFPSIYKMLLALVVVMLLAYYLVGRQTAIPLPGRYEWIMAFFIAAQLVSSLFARNRIDAQIAIEDQVKDLIIIYCIVYALYNPIFLKRAIWVLVITIAFLSFLGTYQVLTSNHSQTFFDLSRFQVQLVVDGITEARLSGPINRPNFWGQILAATMPLVIYLFLLEKRVIVKSLLVATMFSIIFSIFYTYSRGAVVALVATQILIVVERKVSLDIVFVIVIVLLISSSILSPAQLERFGSILLLTDENAGIQQDESFRGRTAELQAGLLMFRDSPFVGVGPSNYEANYLDYAERIGLETRNEERQAHSLYVEVFAETGVIGAIPFTVFFVMLHLEMRRLRQRLKEKDWHEAYMVVTALQMAVLSYLISSLFMHGAFIRLLWGIVALCIAAIYLFTAALKNDSDLIPSDQNLTVQV